MKYLLSISLILLIFEYGTAQEFHASDKYQVVLENFAPGTYENGFYINIFPEEGETAFIRLVNTRDNQEIFKIPLSHDEVDLYEYSKAEVSPDIPLPGIKEVIRLKISYLDCCSDVHNYYFLVNQQGKYIPLPHFKDVRCDGPEPYKAYNFSEASESSDGTIELVELYPDQNFDIDSVKLLATYHLDDGRIE